MPLDLLNPHALQQNYVHQLRQTIDAYSPTFVVIGEALQNALDAVRESAQARRVNVEIDLDDRKVVVADDGGGFPNDPNLLFLGGSNKAGKGLSGLVGVGLKVVLFSSSYFRIRARSAGTSLYFEMVDAFRFDENPAPELLAPETFADDPEPLAADGTELEYRFPTGLTLDPIDGFFKDMWAQCLPAGIDHGFGKLIQQSVETDTFPNRLAALISSFLRRFTYVGNVRAGVGQLPELDGCEVTVRLRCSDAAAVEPHVRELMDGHDEVEWQMAPKYLSVAETVKWRPPPRPSIQAHKLGAGGKNLTRVFSGFDHLVLSSAAEYEDLLVHATNTVRSPDIDEYRASLFPKINSIVLTIGRIPEFDDFLPGSSRRVISAGGVATAHDVSLTRGRNQQYVRCFDVVVDVEAELNYGKTHLKDGHLVNRINRYLNDAYLATIQTAAANWVGKINIDDDDDDVATEYITRADLALAGLATRKVPRDENDVIGLFYELAGLGYFPDIRVYGLSQKDRYDGRAALRRESDDASVLDPDSDARLRTIEFKVHASSVVTDCLRGDKDAKDIDLLIAWDEGTSSSDIFGFADIAHSRAYQRPQGRHTYAHVQRYLQDTNTGAEVQVLLLEPLVKLIADGGLPVPGADAAE